MPAPLTVIIPTLNAMQSLGPCLAALTEGLEDGLIAALIISDGGSTDGVDVLADGEIRQGIKDFSNWPTIPQLYVDRELIGGSDIIGGMYNSGELHELLGVQQPDRVDIEAVRRSLPYGVVTARAVKGGLDVPEEGAHDRAVIASAAIAVRFDLP